MSEDGKGESRLRKVSRVFGGTTDTIDLRSGLSIKPSVYRPGAYEILHPDAGPIDVVDTKQFRSVRELNDYLSQFEVEEPPEDLGRGVA